jgi:hypothetical protein
MHLARPDGGAMVERRALGSGGASVEQGGVDLRSMVCGKEGKW